MSEQQRRSGDSWQAELPASPPDIVVPKSDDHLLDDALLAAAKLTRMPMALTDPNQLDNPIVYVNPAFVDLTGYDAKDVLGQNCRFLQGPETDRAVVSQIRQAVADGHSISVEIYNYRRGGEGFWNALYICPIFDTEGRLVHFFASQMDITKLKDAERRQRQYRDAVGTLASGVAHTVNNLMTGVLAGIDQATRQAIGDTQRLQLARAEQATRSAGRLTQQMLSFAQRQFLQPQVVDLNVLVGAFDDLIDQMAGSDITVEYSLADHPVPARLDPGQFELALMALVRNAADAMPSGGRLVVATRHYTAGVDWVAISITDNGLGMPREVVEQATDPFFSTKPNGTGLGLAAVAGFAEQSGGKWAIESEPRHGTTVRMAFPRHPTHAC